jgi:hypothetical protein
MDLCLLVLRFKELTQQQQHMCMIQAVITLLFRVVHVTHVIAMFRFLPIIVTIQSQVQLTTKIHLTTTKHFQALRAPIT